MTLIQIVLIVAVIAAALVVFRSLSGEKLLAVKRILALLFVLFGISAILFPDILTRVANFFGVGRGTDLLLYLFIVGFLVFAVSVIRAKARSDARVTQLARALALSEARAEAERNKRLD